MTNDDQPLHNRLSDVLREVIRIQMAPNAKLPSERELAKQYQVSRNTVRAALANLENNGIIYRSRGRGTFVTDPVAEPMDLAEAYSFSEQMLDQGREPGSDVLYLQQFPANAYIVEHLGVPVGTPTYKLKRLRLADGVPLMVERTFIPADRFPKLTAEQIAAQGLYRVMAEKYGSVVSDATEAFFASIVSPNDAGLLHVAKGSPGLSVQRTTTDGSGDIIEFTLSVARADQFVYRYHHRHQPGTTQ